MSSTCFATFLTLLRISSKNGVGSHEERSQLQHNCSLLQYILVQYVATMNTFSSRVRASLLSCVALLILFSSAQAMTDKATGISFVDKMKEDLTAFGVGVRKKGPIKVYAVGMYCTETVKESLSAISRAADAKGKEAIALLRKGAKENPTTFLLQMNFKVGAEKMASAIAESVSPRHSDESEVEDLKALIFKGVSEKGAAVKGTKIQFDCDPEAGVDVSVDGKEQGNVPSGGLAAAFCDVYLDDKCVSQQLKESCLDNCCSP